MIITRAPLRISLGGGGTDLPSYYREHTGFVISAAIDKYVYITLHETFSQELLVGPAQSDVKPVVPTRDDLQRWVDAAYWSLLSESTVPWVAAGSLHRSPGLAHPCSMRARRAIPTQVSQAKKMKRGLYVYEA